jgi:glycerol-3-phosphate acyltransferase PlsY
LVGGIPVGVLVCRAYGIDIMKVGSGNIGTTNVSRALGKKAWVLVFLPDVLKGVIPALVSRRLFPVGAHGIDAQTLSFIAGLFAVLGHCASPFLRFRGGKGVATALGAGLGAAPIVALSSFALFGVVLFTVDYMVVASTVGVSAPFVLGFVIPGQSLQLEPFYAALAIIVTARHRPNFVRLRKGTEPRFRRKQSIASTSETKVDSEPR